MLVKICLSNYLTSIIPSQFCLGVAKTSELKDEQLCMCSAHIAHLPIPPRQLKGSLAREHASPTLPYITLGAHLGSPNCSGILGESYSSDS